MTVSTAPTTLSYAGDGSTTSFPVSWKYNAKSHVVATLRSSTGVETVWALTTNYTLTDPGDSGTLTAVVAPATGETLVITLEPPNTQSSDIPLGGDFASTTVEDGLDLAAQRDGKIEALFLRALRVPKTDTQTGSSLELPIDSLRANKFLGFNASGAPIAAAGTSANLGPVSAFIDTLLDDTTAAMARTTLGAVGLTGNETVAGVKTFTGANVHSGAETFETITAFTDGIGPSYIQNIGLAVSVAAKALTVALKTKALADPSAGSPVEISFRNRTLTTGDYVVRKITAVSSIVVPSGATLGFTANEAGTVYVYVCDNGTICEVGVSKKAVFDESLLHTTTAITTGADSNNVLYTTTALTTAAVRLIGRIDITTGAVAGEWDNEDTRVYTGNNIYVGGLLFNPTGWSFIEKKTASSSTSLDFTLPAGYDAFRFTLFSIAPATDDSALYVRFSNDGGSTFLAGTGYSSSAVGRQSAGTVEAIDVSGGAQIIIGSADISDSIGNDVREALSGSITVYGALNAAVNTKLTGEITYAAASAGEVVLTVGGRYVAAEAHNAIRFFMESGNIASGIIAIEGFRTS